MNFVHKCFSLVHYVVERESFPLLFDEASKSVLKGTLFKGFQTLECGM